MDLYLILGLDRSATDEQIKAAFREKVKFYHPDSPGGGDRNKFQDVKRAYQVLSNSLTRAQYDRSGLVENSFDPVNQAMQVLCGWLRMVIEGNTDDPKNLDLIGLMKKQIGIEEKNLRENHHKLSKSLRKINQISKRLIKKDDVQPFLLVAMNDKKKKWYCPSRT